MTDYALLQVSRYGAPLAVVLAFVLAGLLAQQVLLPLLRRLAARSRWRLDDLLVEVLSGPLLFWFTLAGIGTAIQLLPLEARVARWLGLGVLVVAIMSVSWALARFAAGAVAASTAIGGAQSVSLLASVARWIIVVVGILVALQTVGVKITPLITALGIGGLAVGLALQDTLANFFSGIRILAARQIRPGDFVVLETGQEGWVEDITWSQTTVRQPSNNLVLVPNARLATAITTNYMLPILQQNVVVQLGVAYGSDLERVEETALAAARETQRAVPEATPDFEPALRYKEFGASSINFFVVLQARSFPERWSVVSDYIKRVHARFQAEGIEIPFPVQTVIVKDGRAAER